MQRMLRFGVLALTLLLFPLAGCETKEVWVEVPSFGQGSIDGIWLWRLSEAGTFERACRILLGDVESQAGGESLGYIQDCDDGHGGVDLETRVQRSPARPETVTIGLWYMRWEDPGTYKVSSYGADGESALSDTTLPL